MLRAPLPPTKHMVLSSAAACRRQTQTEISKSPQSGDQQHITPSERGMKKGCQLIIFCFYPLPLFASFDGVPVSGVGSPRGLVLAPTAAAGLATVVARAQRQVAAHAGCDKRERHQGQPAQTELLVRSVT